MTWHEHFGRAWQHTWFEGGSPHDLAAARIVVALHAMWILLSRDLPGMAGVPALFWELAPRSTQWRYLLFHGHPGLERAFLLLTFAALAAVLLGRATRVAALGAALLLYHLAPLETLFWGRDNPMERGFEITILALVLLAFAPCADAWSARRPRAAPERAAWEYRWPLVLIQLFLAQVYVFAGYAKLRSGGLAWMEPDNLRRWFLVFTQYESVAVFTAAGRFMAAHPRLCGLLAVATVGGELLFLLVLVSRYARRVLVPLAALSHVGILVSMNIAFLNAPQLLVFVNWEWLRGVARRFRGASPAPPGRTSGPPA